MRAVLLIAALVVSAAALAQRQYGDPYSGAMQTINMYVQQNNAAAFRTDFQSPAYQVQRQIWQPSFFSQSSSGGRSVERTAEDKMLEARGLESYYKPENFLIPFGARDGWRPPAATAEKDIWSQYQNAGANAAAVVASAEALAKAGDTTAMLVLALAQLQGRGAAANEAKALEWLRQAADAGVPQAALYYARGLLGSDTNDYATALRYLRKAETVVPEAAAEIGLILAEGRPGVPADPAAGAAAFERAAKTGSAMGQYLYAISLQTGTGTARDPAAAIAWLEKSSAQNLPMAQLRLGQALYFGSGVAADYRRALLLLEQAAAAGETGAFNALGLYYGDGLAVAEDAARATGYFRRGAELGDPRAQANLGLALMGGIGVAEDHREAARWLAPAAAAGIPEAEYGLGLLALIGLGMAPDDARGLQLVRQSAARNFPMAYDTLCTLTLGGRAGMHMDAAEFTPTLMTGISLNQPACLYVQASRLSRGILNPRDQQQAMDFLKRAAEGGFARAELDYAFGFLNLIGKVEPSYDEGLAAEARHWLTRAADHGNQDAERILRERGWR